MLQSVPRIVALERPGVDPIELFFFASKEFLHFLLLSEVILLSLIFSICNKTLKLNNENMKTKKKEFHRIGSSALARTQAGIYSSPSIMPSSDCALIFKISIGEESSQPTKHANKIISSIFLIMMDAILDTHGMIMYF